MTIYLYMASSNNITIHASLDGSSIQRGLTSAANAINTFGAGITKKLNPLNSFQEALGGIPKALSPLSLAISGVSNTVKQAISTMQEYEKAWSETEQTLKRVDFASNLNENLGTSSTAIKQWADDLGGAINNFFDDGAILQTINKYLYDMPIDQLKKATEAATDLAAATGMSLQSAVDSLVKTYNGDLDKSLKSIIPELSNLTKEQIAAGDAIALVQQKVKGAAQEMGNSVSGSLNAANVAMGNLKAELGAIFTEALTPCRNFFTELVGGWASALKAQRIYKEAVNDVHSGTANIDQATQVASRTSAIYNKKLTGLEDDGNLELYKSINGTTKFNYQQGYIMSLAKDAETRAAGEKQMNTALATISKQLGHQTTAAGLNSILQTLQAEAEANQAKAVLSNAKDQARKDANEKANAENKAMANIKLPTTSYTPTATAKEKTETDYIAEFRKTIQDAVDSIEAQRQTGDDVSDADEAERMISTIKSGFEALYKNTKINFDDKRISDIVSDYEKFRQVLSDEEQRKLDEEFAEINKATDEWSNLYPAFSRIEELLKPQSFGDAFAKISTDKDGNFSNKELLKSVIGKSASQNQKDNASEIGALTEALKEAQEYGDTEKENAIQGKITDLSSASGLGGLEGVVSSLGQIGEIISGIMNSNPLGILTSAASSFMSMLSSIENVSSVLNAFGTIFSAMQTVIEPILNGIFRPFVIILQSIGEVLGLLLMPALTLIKALLEPIFNVILTLLDCLMPIITIISQLLSLMIQFNPILQIISIAFNALGQVIAWVHNTIVVPVANWVIDIFITVFNAFIWVKNKVSDVLKTITFGIVDLGHTQELNKEDYHIQAVTATNDSMSSAYSNNSSSSGGASYSGARDITVNIAFSNSFVNGDAREIALMLRQEIHNAEALGY